MYYFILDEQFKKACGAVDHAGCLRLLRLRTWHQQSIIHVAFLVQSNLKEREEDVNKCRHLLQTKGDFNSVRIQNTQLYNYKFYINYAL